MKKNIILSDLLLLTTSIVWGFAFVAQRVGMEYIGPYLYNGIRFALGAVSLIPLVFIFKPHEQKVNKRGNDLGILLTGGVISGFVLFGGATLQQIGMVYTTAGNGGFITGLYVILVPIFGLFLKRRANFLTWLGAVAGLIGLYLLSVNENFTMQKGDFFVLLSAFFWAMHFYVLDYFSPRVSSLKLSIVQFLVCSLLSLIISGFTEKSTLAAVQLALIPILYGGLCSVGIGYTLQVVGQKNAHPAHAAIILSLESLFAVIGGLLLLGERLTLKGWTGCGLMLLGMLLAKSEYFFPLKIKE
ncbi:MAG: DMT family transporter [Spirochaetes bacterium]|nr:DMT family transporter [Spirochaetota bacterium]